MISVGALFFDVFGTLVDWRAGVARDHLEPRVGADQLANALPVATIEPFDIHSQEPNQCRIGGGLDLPKRPRRLDLRPSAMKCCLDSAHGGINETGNLIQ